MNQINHPIYEILDTNVPVVANGKSTQASPECVINCMRRVQEFDNDLKILVLDDEWRIIKEYQNNLRSVGQPGIGDHFLKWVLTNYKNPFRCSLVKIHESNSMDEFEEFPNDNDLITFDPSDKKFVAVSRAHEERPSIVQAVDTKWKYFRETLSRYEVNIEFICK